MKKFTSAALTALLLTNINYHVAAQANTSLSNLAAPTSVNQSLVPNVTGTLDLGSGANTWRYAYIGSRIYLNGSLTIHATGSLNYFAGANAGNTALTGSSNTAAGHYALNRLTTGSQNVANGYAALYNNTTGYQNTASGAYSLYRNVSGTLNAATGINSLYNNTTGSANVAMGYSPLYRNTSGNSNIAIGNSAMYNNTTGNSNTGIGVAALIANTTGNNSVAIGGYTLYNNTSGYSNIAVGVGALNHVTNQSNLVAIGDSALYNNGTGGTQWQGIVNTAVGSKALYTNTTGSYNSVLGRNGMLYNTTGSFNCTIGFASMEQNTTGFHNTALGYFAFGTNTTGSYNTAVGAFTGVSANNLTNATAIGYNTTVNASNKVVIGNTSVTVIGGQVGWSILSDGRFKKNVKENVPGLAFINKLRPVTYNVEVEKYERFTGKKDSLIQLMKNEIAGNERKLRTGFIAQEVEKAANEINYDFDGVNKPQNDKDNYSIVYSDFIPSLVKAIQELSKENTALKERLAQVEQKIGVTAIQNNAATQVPAGLSLQQNRPNPFSNATVINYAVPAEFKHASIVISDMNGSIVKNITLPTKGNGSISISAGTIAAGVYTYTLVADGKTFDSKQMIIAK